jgi:F-type H+-transporting ATPase subunit gamma
MAKTRELRRRIRSIGSTRKITHAMELVAGAKMRRAQTTVLGTRRYAELAWELLSEVRNRSEVARHPLLDGRSPVRRSALFVISGNRGLVGAFHEHVLARALALVAEDSSAPLVVTMGRIVRDRLHRRGVAIDADFPKPDLLTAPADASPVAQFLLSRFLSGEVDRVRLVYADFASVLRQDVRVKTLLPVSGDADHELGTVVARAVSPLTPRPSSHSPVEYLFEPSPTTVLEAVVPKLLSVQVYQALLETTASEHAARMVAMRNATQNADEIHDDLVLVFNEARKAGITQEILEIVSGQLGISR